MKFTAEQITKAAECTSAQELQALAKSEGIELTDAEAETYFLALKESANTLDGIANGEELDDEALEKVAGGKCDEFCDRNCPGRCPGRKLFSGS